MVSQSITFRLILSYLAVTLTGPGPTAPFISTAFVVTTTTRPSSSQSIQLDSTSLLSAVPKNAASSDTMDKENNAAPWVSLVSTDPNPLQALSSLIERATIGERKNEIKKKSHSLAFLFVGSYHAMSFEALVSQASQTFPNLVSIVSGGVIGDGVEYDEPTVPCMALLTGIIPMRQHGVRWFEFNELHNKPPEPEDTFWKETIDTSSSYLLFADPWSPLESVLTAMRGSSIVGGISVPMGPGSTIAMNGRHLPQGSLVAIEWPGEVMQVVVAQGCRPIDKPYTVTAVKGNTIAEMDGRPAVEVWNNVLQGIQSPSARSAVVCGIRINRNDRLAGAVTIGTNNKDEDHNDDYLIRQIIGRTTTMGLVIAGRVRMGDTVRFHVRDSIAARADLHLMMSRAVAGRLWHGPPILAALQISCVARGRFLFGSSNIDIEETTKLSGDYTPIGGFFANGEIGPVGLSGFSGKNEPTETFLHGFTTVVALLCARTVETTEKVTNAAIEQTIDAWG